MSNHHESPEEFRRRLERQVPKVQVKVQEPNWYRGLNYWHGRLIGRVNPGYLTIYDQTDSVTEQTFRHGLDVDDKAALVLGVARELLLIGRTAEAKP